MNEELKLVRTAFTGDKGLYVLVVPDERSAKILSQISNCLGVETDPEKYHVTLMYSPDNEPERIDLLGVPEAFEAKIVGIDFFGEKKDHCVVLLVSGTMQAEHQRLTNLGAKHTFTPFRPHVTISGNATSKDVSKTLLDDVVSLCKNKILRFIGYNWANIDKG